MRHGSLFFCRCNFLLNKVTDKILLLSRRREKYLVVGAVRFVRAILSRHVCLNVCADIVCFDFGQCKCQSEDPPSPTLYCINSILTFCHRLVILWFICLTHTYSLISTANKNPSPNQPLQNEP